jgi:hypothetical protein
MSLFNSWGFIYDFKLSWQLYGMKSSRAIGHVSIELISDVSEAVLISIVRGWCVGSLVRTKTVRARSAGAIIQCADVISHQHLMMETELVSETFDTNSTLTWPIDRENFIEYKLMIILFSDCYTVWMWAILPTFWRCSLPPSSELECVGWLMLYVHKTH